MTKPIRIAMIGCGAISEKCHLPVLAELKTFQLTALVDKNISRAETLASKFKVPRVFGDYHEALETVDAVIVALPHFLHAPVAMDCLNQGVHALVEKPMALNSKECDAMIKAAQQKNAVLAVGLMLRFWRSAQFVKQWLDSGLWGHIKSFDIRDGAAYRWPITSDFMFRKDKAGGGVLMDQGVHVLDLLLWWFGEVSSVEYYDDSYGGIEADCKIDLKMRSGVKGTVELSRTRGLRNTAVLCFEEATLELELGGYGIDLKPNAGFKAPAKILSELKKAPNNKSILKKMFGDQLLNFADAIRNKKTPLVSGIEGRCSVSVVETCYAERRLWKFPWMNLP